ncbi:hypothetical protein HYQ46_001320 [Verticillium longisporum]|nr:hypothetical protein HYQ46_001320 [Verticillium longisporum]
MDEKLRCEVATYVWIEEHCRDIPIPKLHAFGFTDGRQFTQHDQASLLARFCRYIRRQVHRLFGLPLLSNYHLSSSPPTFKIGHMLLEYIRPDVGQMLSTTWEPFKDEPQRSKQYELYDATRQTFLSIMDEERTAKQKELTLILRNSWESKGVWFWASLKSLNAWHFLFQDHILPKFFANKQAIALLKPASNLW